MADLAYNLEIWQAIAIWSDQAEKRASKFADNHRDLLPRRITNSQLYGLTNSVRSVRRFNELLNFVHNQGNKAERAGRLDVRDYWSDLGNVLNGLKDEASELIKQAELRKEINKTANLDILQIKLAEAFVQHLVAHSLYWTPLSEDTNKKS